MGKNVTLKDYKKIVCFDTETTGVLTEPLVLSNGTIKPIDQIIEIGLVIYSKDENGNFSKLEKKKDLFVKTLDGRRPEDMYIDKVDKDGNPMTISDLTGITSEMLNKSGITEKEMVDSVFYDIFQKDTLILGYNLQFDLKMIFNAITKYYPAFRFEGQYDVFDVFTYYKDYYGYCNFVNEKGEKLAQKLDAAVKLLKVSVVNTHRACDDADATWEVFLKVYEKHYFFKPYINTFGYNPKYSIVKIPYIDYYPQNFKGDCSVKKQVTRNFYNNAANN